MKRINEETVSKAIRDLQDEAYERFGHEVGISVNTWISEGEGLAAKVSWASLGVQTPEDAEAFASKILEAAEMAKAFPYEGAILLPVETDDEGYEDYWYEMDDEETEEESEEYENPMYLDPYKYDDRYYNDDEEEEDEQEEEDEYEVISSFIKSMDPETRDEWRFGDGRIDITIDDDPTHWSFVFWKLPFPYDHYDDIIYGLGAARYLDDILGEEYDASPLDIETTIATARMRDILQDYEDIRRGRPWRKNVHEMAVTWAAAIGGELHHETDTPSTMEHASGEIGHHHIEVIYNEI